MYTVPIPSVTVTVHPSSPLYAGTTSVILTCTITLSDNVDTDVMMEVTWFRSGTSLTNATSRVTISPLAESGRTFSSNLTLPLLYPEDNRTFSCMAVAHPKARHQVILTSDLAMDSTSINVMIQGKCDICEDLTISYFLFVIYTKLH